MPQQKKAYDQIKEFDNAEAELSEELRFYRANVKEVEETNQTLEAGINCEENANKIEFKERNETLIQKNEKLRQEHGVLQTKLNDLMRLIEDNRNFTLEKFEERKQELKERHRRAIPELKTLKMTSKSKSTKIIAIKEFNKQIEQEAVSSGKSFVDIVYQNTLLIENLKFRVRKRSAEGESQIAEVVTRNKLLTVKIELMKDVLHNLVVNDRNELAKKILRLLYQRQIQGGPAMETVNGLSQPSKVSCLEVYQVILQQSGL